MLRKVTLTKIKYKDLFPSTESLGRCISWSLQGNRLEKEVDLRIISLAGGQGQLSHGGTGSPGPPVSGEVPLQQENPRHMGRPLLVER
jgi:hypothetical protein